MQGLKRAYSTDLRRLRWRLPLPPLFAADESDLECVGCVGCVEVSLP